MDTSDFDSQIEKLEAERAARIARLESEFPYQGAGFSQFDIQIRLIDESLKALKLARAKYIEHLGPSEKSNPSESVAIPFSNLMKSARVESQGIESYLNYLEKSESLENCRHKYNEIDEAIKELGKTNYLSLKVLSPTSLESLEKAKRVCSELLKLDYELNNVVYDQEKRLYNEQQANPVHNARVNLVTIKPDKNEMWGLLPKFASPLATEINQLKRFLGKHDTSTSIKMLSGLLNKERILLTAVNTTIDLNVEAAPIATEHITGEKGRPYIFYLFSEMYRNLSASWNDLKLYIITVDGVSFLISQGDIALRESLLSTSAP